MAIFIVFLLLTATPTYAQSSSTINREQLQMQITLLLEQIKYLQDLIAAREQREQNRPELLYETNFYEADFEAVYQVTPHGLTRIDGGNILYSNHQQLWELFLSTIGAEAAHTYIGEFRVFNEPDSPFGAFVETKPHLPSEKASWILAVNESGYDPTSSTVSDLFADLFIHEYAHILQYHLPDFVTKFENTFWQTSDQIHANRLVDAESSTVERELEAYYDKNKDRFVSDYATLNVTEDLAETFTIFVHNEQRALLGTSVKDDKVRMLYTNPTLTAARTTIRKNLGIN